VQRRECLNTPRFFFFRGHTCCAFHPNLCAPPTLPPAVLPRSAAGLLHRLRECTNEQTLCHEHPRPQRKNTVTRAPSPMDAMGLHRYALPHPWGNTARPNLAGASGRAGARATRKRARSTSPRCVVADTRRSARAPCAERKPNTPAPTACVPAYGARTTLRTVPAADVAEQE
jgi:hypothetical protein